MVGNGSHYTRQAAQKAGGENSARKHAGLSAIRLFSWALNS